MNNYIGYASAIMLLIIVIRTTTLFVLSFIHDAKTIKEEKKRKVRFDILPYRPRVSVVISAYNEEAGIYHTLDSIYKNDYPNFEVIVISDGSKDNTAGMVEKFRQDYNPKDLIFAEQPNGGKGSGLNNGIKNYATGKLIMTLDADSILDSEAIKNAVKYFAKDEVVASAANIKVVDNNKLISFMHIVEYLLAHRYKRSYMLMNMDFVIGGPGAVFRKEILDKVGHYETGTITEDLDMTLKIIELGNKANRIIFAPDVKVYTEAPFYLKSLHKQRFRWKKGKYQSLYKHRHMFFNTSKKYSKTLTMFFLPYSMLLELSLFLEPFFIAYMLYFSISNRDVNAMLGSAIFLAFFMFATLATEDDMSNKMKIKLLLLAPFTFLFMYVITIIEYLSLIRTWLNWNSLFGKTEEKGNWEHVERLGKLSIK
jgi:poly-beta-1,6-N-acetyl-D-glucosamine synthase